MFKEFKEFAMKGNVVDMAVGIIIGGAFGTIVKSLVDHILMPPIGLFLGGMDFSGLFLLLKDGKTPPPYATLAQAQEAGAVTLNFGLFLNSVISFVIVAFALPTTRDCPFCATAIPIPATRCPHCTSQL